MRTSRFTSVLLVILLVVASAGGSRALAASPYVVTAFGAVGDGTTKDTVAIQKAIDAAHDAGGGTVHVAPGTYLTGTLYLKSGVTLRLDAGATLLGSTDITDYPKNWPAFRSYTDNYVYQSLLAAEDAEDIAVVGRGAIDGQGGHDVFRRKVDGRRYGERPYIIRFVNCRNVHVEGITLRNSAMWVQHYLACDNLTVRGVTVYSRVHHNNDGINIDGCRFVRISDCHISSGDDAIVLKSSSERACENVTVSNCVLSTSCNGLKLGTESNGGFRNIVLTGCALYDVGLAGIALEMVDGGTVENVIVSDISMTRAGGAIFLRLGNRARPFKPDMDKPGIGQFRHVIVSHVIATGIGSTASSITGLPGHPIEDVSLSDIRIVYAGGGTAEDAARAVPERPAAYPEYQMLGRLPAYGLYCRHVDGLTLRNVGVSWAKPDARSVLVCEQVKDLDVDGVNGLSQASAAPFVVLRGVQGAQLTGCRPRPAASVFCRLEGATEGVSVTGCDLTGAATAFAFGDATPPTALFQAANRLPD